MPETRNVLLVEDEDGIRAFMEDALRGRGFRVFSAADTMQATAFAREATFDILVLDFSMPGGDGYSLYKRIRSIPNTQQTPIVFVTGSAPKNLMLEMILRDKLVRYLPKPVKLPELFVLIDQLAPLKP